MQQYTSEEALNGILNIILTTVNEYNQSKQNKASGQTSSLIEELLAGVGASASKGVNLGDQVKTLADGMSMLKSQGITQDDATNVAFMIGTIGKAVANLEFNPASTDAVLAIALSLAILGKIDSAVIDNIAYIAAHLDASSAKNIYDFVTKLDAAEAENIATVVNAFNEFAKIDIHTLDNITTIAEAINYDVGANISQFFAEFNVDEKTLQSVTIVAQALTALGGINEDVIKNINKLGEIDTNVAAQLNNFIKSLDFTNAEALQDENVKQSISILSTFINEILNILNKTNLGFKTLFLPMKGRLVGKAIAAFFNELIKVIPKDEIKLEIDGLGQLMQSFYPLIEKDGKYSIGKLLRVMTAKNGQAIGMFFAAIVEPIPDDKKIKDTITSISALLQLVSSFGLKDYIKIRKLLTKENGEKIGQFFEAIILPLNQTEYPDFKPITDFLKALSNLGLLGVITLALLKPILTPKFGESISGFITKLVDGLDEDKMNRLKNFSEAMKNVGTGIILLTGSIVLLAAAIEIFGALTVIGATVIAVAFVGSVIMMLNFLTKAGDNIKKGTAAMMDIAKALLLLTLDVYLLTGAALLMALVDWESLGKVVVMMVVLGLFVAGAMYIADKWDKGGANMQKAFLGVGALLLMGAAAIGLAVYIARENKIEDILLGIGMVALVIVGTYFMITKLLEKADKDYETALKNVAASIAIIAATALIANFLLAPLSEKVKEITIGAVMVLAIIGIMVAIVKWLAKEDLKNLQLASIAMAVMTGVVLAVSLIALFLFPMINENAENIIMGGIIVIGIITIMSLIVWGLSNIKPDNLKAARDAILAEALILGVVGVIAAFLLVPIGENFGGVMLGFLAVGIIIAAMIGMTYLLSMVDEKDLSAASNAILAISALIAVVSLVSLFLFIPIGERAKEVGFGALIVMGIILVMAGIVWVLSRCEEDNLKMATIAMGVITLVILAISVIALTLFIPIADEWESVLIGGGIVIGIVAIMALMVWGLSNVKEDNLKMAMISMVVMALILLGVSLITKEILIPIGYEAEQALYGAGIVLGVVGIMAAIVWAVSNIQKEKVLPSIAVMAAIALVLWGVSEIVENYFIPIGEEGEKALIGGALILGTIGIMALIIAAAGLMDLKTIGKGALVVAGIGGILWLLGEMLPSYIDLCLKMEKDDKKIAIGGLEIVATLTAWGLIMVAIGALMSYGAAFLAMGAAAITGIAGVLYLIAQALPDYMNLCIKMHDNKKAIKSGGLAIESLISEWGLIMAAIGAMMMIPFVAPALTVGAATVATISATIYALSKALDPYIDIIIKMKENNINEANIAKFTKTMVGNGIDDDKSNSLIASIIRITKALSEVGAWTAVQAGFIAKQIRPIFETIGMFIDIIGRICSMKYVSEWDENGKPAAYETLTLTMFKQAGDTVSITFGTFLKQLGEGLEKLKDVSYATILLLSAGIGPVMSAIKDFTDAILSVLSSRIPDEYDENGKPIKWRKFDSAEFYVAATLITDAFLIFLEKFSSKSKNISLKSAAIINMFKDGIEPVMNAVATWTNTIMDFVTGREITITDPKTGKDIKQRFQIDPEKFKEHGKTVADTFIGFIDGLWNQFSKYGYTEHHYQVESHALKSDTITDNAVEKNHVTDLITGFSNISEIMGAVETFINMIFAVAEKAGSVDLKAQGKLIGDVFVNFINTLCDAFVETSTTNGPLGMKFEETAVGKKLTLTLEGLEKVKKMATSFDKVMNSIVDIIKKYEGKATKEQIDGIYAIMTHFIQTENVSALMTLGTYDLKPTVKFMKLMEDISDELEDIGKNMKELKQITDACTTLIAAMKIIQDGKDNLTGFTARDVSGLVPFLDKIADAAELLNKFAELTQDKETVTKAVAEFIKQITSFSAVGKDNNPDWPDIHKVAPLPRYLQYVNKTAEYLVRLSEIMNSADITAAITKFLKDIDLLTQKDLQKKTAASQKALISFQIDLKNFTAQVVTSQKKVIKFTTSMKKATDALRKFDDAIVNRERERNEALQKFGDLVKNIADNMNSLNTEINNLDQNKIMSNFRGIGDLFNMVLGRSNDNERQNNQNQNNNQLNNQNQRQQNNQQNQRGQQNQTTQQIVNTRPQGRQVINVYFADTTLSGFVESVE